MNKAFWYDLYATLRFLLFIFLSGRNRNSKNNNQNWETFKYFFRSHTAQRIPNLVGGSYHHFVSSLLSREISVPSILPPSFQRSKHSVSPSNRLTKDSTETGAIWSCLYTIMMAHSFLGYILQLVVWKLLQTNRKQIEYVAFWTRRVLNKVLYGEVPPWPGLNPHRFIYHFSQKRYPFRIRLLPL